MEIAHQKDPLGTPCDTVDIEDINAWGVLLSAPSSLQSSFKSEEVGDNKIRSTVVTDSLIIHELDNRLCDSDHDGGVLSPDNTTSDSTYAAHTPLGSAYTPLGSAHTPLDGALESELVTEKVDIPEEVKCGKHFQVDEEINNKVSFWCGNIAKVQSEGCISSCTELLRERQPAQTTQLLKSGCTELQKQVFNTYRCTTGDIVVFKASILPIRHVILTAGPKYNVKYQSAAENTLYNCYRNSFDCAMDKRVETMTIGKIHNAHKQYPAKEAVHLALRTTRRYLEKHRESFRKICFVLCNISDMVVYQELFPYYFPRNSSDYKFQLELPDDIGGDYGEPQHHGTVTNYIKAHWSTSSESLAKKLNVSRSEFCSMKQDPDRARLFEQSQQTDVYNQLLQWSRIEDLSRVAKCRAMYHSGFDLSGCPIVVCVGKHFPTHLSEHKVLSHCIQVMDPVTIKPYVLVYFHTGTTGPRKDIEMMQNMFASAPPRYKLNLKALYSLHATNYMKFQTWLFTMSKAKEVKGKVAHFSSLKCLFEKISPDQLQVPQFILDFDYQLNGATE